MSKPKKILVIRFSSIGDIVLTTPVVRGLHQQLGTEVHFLTKPSFAGVLSSNPYIAKVITLADNIDDTIRQLRDEDYDFVADLHHNLRSKRIRLALRKPSKAFYKLNFEKWLLVNFKINRLPPSHIVGRYMEVVNSLGVTNDGEGLDFFIPVEKNVDVTSLGITRGHYTAMVIGAAHATKCMTSSQIARLTELIPHPVVLMGGKQEQAKAEEIISLSASNNIINACGPYDISQSASLLEQAGSIISHDTGLMHIASALQKQQIVVWGNTVPSFGMYPYYGLRHAVEGKWYSFEINNLPCRPCSKLGYPKCPKGHFKCMLDQNLEHIAKAALIPFT